MNDRQIDLNLMQIFYSIMSEGNVTRAAQRLAMTQPAVSNALVRLRHLFQDDLFTKARGGMRPTERAIAIWPDIQDAIGKLRTMVGTQVFDPMTSHQIFDIAITDCLRYWLAPALAEHLITAAPNVMLHLHPHTDIGSMAELEASRLNCALGMFPRPAAGLHVDALFADDFVCVMRKENPLSRQTLTLKAFAAANHVLVKSSGAGHGVVDDWLDLKGLTRHIPLVVNHYTDALETVRRTDLITTIPRSLVWMMDRSRCKVVKLPFATERILFKMLWPDKYDRDPAQVWLRSTLKTLLLSPETTRTITA